MSRHPPDNSGKLVMWCHYWYHSGDPRINIQDQKGKAKAYQVRQVLLAIDKLEGMRNER